MKDGRFFNGVVLSLTDPGAGRCKPKSEQLKTSSGKDVDDVQTPRRSP